MMAGPWPSQPRDPRPGRFVPAPVLDHQDDPVAGSRAACPGRHLAADQILERCAAVLVPRALTMVLPKPLGKLRRRRRRPRQPVVGASLVSSLTG
jgi:hypothetical protein